MTYARFAAPSGAVRSSSRIGASSVPERSTVSSSTTGTAVGTSIPVPEAVSTAAGAASVSMNSIRSAG